MPSLFDLCQNTEPLEKLQKISDDIRKREYDEVIRKHRASHIFDSYEDALDWLVKNPDRTIEWHAKTLSYITEENLFLSYEQEYSSDGIVSYDIKRKYTREELLNQIYNHIKERGYDLEKDFKDEYGKLDYVYKRLTIKEIEEMNQVF
jgi:hypothetical protein